MKELTLKQLYNIVESPFVLDPTMAYPEIEGDESNFLEEYNTNKASYDRYFLKEHGKKIVDMESDEDSDIATEWANMIADIQRVYLNSWAHIYYTLNIAYNPVYNVEEHTTTKYGEHETDVEYGQHETDRQYGEHKTDVEYGQHETDMQYGATQDTLGSHTDTSTDYSVSYDSATEHETGKNSNVVGSQTNSSITHTDTETSKLHTDTTTSKLHTDTVDRTGNIGIKSATALATEEVFMREKQIFFKNIFLTITREVGAYYDCTII